MRLQRPSSYDFLDFTGSVSSQADCCSPKQLDAAYFKPYRFDQHAPATGAHGGLSRKLSKSCSDISNTKILQSEIGFLEFVAENEDQKTSASKRTFGKLFRKNHRNRDKSQRKDSNDVKKTKSIFTSMSGLYKSKFDVKKHETSLTNTRDLSRSFQDLLKINSSKSWNLPFNLTKRTTAADINCSDNNNNVHSSTLLGDVSATERLLTFDHNESSIAVNNSVTPAESRNDETFADVSNIDIPPVIRITDTSSEFDSRSILPCVSTSDMEKTDAPIVKRPRRLTYVKSSGISLVCDGNGTSNGTLVSREVACVSTGHALPKNNNGGAPIISNKTSILTEAKESTDLLFVCNGGTLPQVNSISTPGVNSRTIVSNDASFSNNPDFVDNNDDSRNGFPTLTRKPKITTCVEISRDSPCISCCDITIEDNISGLPTGTWNSSTSTDVKGPTSLASFRKQRKKSTAKIPYSSKTSSSDQLQFLIERDPWVTQACRTEQLREDEGVGLVDALEASLESDSFEEDRSCTSKAPENVSNPHLTEENNGNGTAPPTSITSILSNTKSSTFGNRSCSKNRKRKMVTFSDILQTDIERDVACDDAVDDDSFGANCHGSSQTSQLCGKTETDSSSPTIGGEIIIHRIDSCSWIPEPAVLSNDYQSSDLSSTDEEDGERDSFLDGEEDETDSPVVSVGKSGVHLVLSLRAKLNPERNFSRESHLNRSIYRSNFTAPNASVELNAVPASEGNAGKDDSRAAILKIVKREFDECERQCALKLKEAGYGVNDLAQWKDMGTI